MGKEGVKKLGGKGGVQPQRCYEPRRECVLCSGSTSARVFLTPPASYISRMLVIEPDTMSTSRIPSPPVLIMASLRV